MKERRDIKKQTFGYSYAPNENYKNVRDAESIFLSPVYNCHPYFFLISNAYGEREKKREKNEILLCRLHCKS